MSNKQQIEWKVEGMTCANCAKSITRFLENKQLNKVEVNFATKEVSFEVIESQEIESLKSGIAGLGFQVVGEQSSQLFWTLERKFLFTLFFTLPLFLHMFLPHGPLDDPWVQLALCIPVFLMGVYHFGRSAWHSIQMGIPNMDVLIFIGSSAAFGYSLAGNLLQLGPDYLFYETTAMIITLVLMGNLIESKAVKRTTSSIDALKGLQAEYALKLFSDGQLKKTPTAKIKVGDILQVNLGDAVPVDGMILEGTALIDESMLTGESVAVKRIPGDSVVGASIIKDGQIKIQVTHTGRETVLNQIISMVKKAQAEKPDIQRLADKISAIFVPVVLIISLLTFLISWGVVGIEVRQALLNSIAVLVISCPCAMGLATPTAVMVGVGRAARNGVLFKGGQTLELLAGIRHFIFDKTGTLTTTTPKLSDWESFNGLGEQSARQIILELEQHSSHPLANSIRSAIQSEGLNIEASSLLDIQEIQGQGILGTNKQGQTLRIGHSGFALNQADQFESDDTRIWLSKDFKPLAAFRIEEALHPESQSVIQALKQDRISTYLLSGDRLEKTKKIAAELGIQEYYAEQSPAQKLEQIERLNTSHQAAMIGDGINDAPALAKATIGISMNQASAAAIQSAQVVLMGNSIKNLPFARQISQKTVRTIKENLFWAFSYNIVAIPLAALGFLNPMWAALFMAFSDVVVIGNSIRLNFRKLNN
ncbi:MAG: cation-translocating P-type ATPase [Bacteroidota bacterium]